jgi:cyclopropane-fatty-acyl-phospholipid synthase
LADYRELWGRYDKVVSIGMFEHVGKRFIPTFMRKVQSLLKVGGVGLLHTIGKERESPVNSWTLKYIFPGGYIPVLHETLRELAMAGLESIDVENLRLHYARTLDLWAERFEEKVGRVRQLYNESFVRMWRLFLRGSAAGFRFGDSRLYQLTFSNGLNNSLPITRDHIYR